MPSARSIRFPLSVASDFSAARYKNSAAFSRLYLAPLRLPSSSLSPFSKCSALFPERTSFHFLPHFLLDVAQSGGNAFIQSICLLVLSFTPPVSQHSRIGGTTSFQIPSLVDIPTKSHLSDLAQWTSGFVLSLSIALGLFTCFLSIISFRAANWLRHRNVT